MGRSTKKGPYVDLNLLEKVQKMNASNEKKPIKTWARACTIIPEFVGHSLFFLLDIWEPVKLLSGKFLPNS